MTPNEFAKRQMVEKALNAQIAHSPVDKSALQGCVLMAVQMARRLKVTDAELAQLVATECTSYDTYIEVKRRLIEKKKAQK